MSTVNQGSSLSVSLAAGHALSVIADALSSGVCYNLGGAAGDQPGPAIAVAAEATVMIGPFAEPTRILVEAQAGFLTYGDAPIDPQAALPLTTPGDLLICGADGKLARLEIEDDGDVLTLVDGMPAWAPPV